MTCNSRRISFVLLALIVAASAVCLDQGRAQEKKDVGKGAVPVPVPPPPCAPAPAPGAPTPGGPEAGMNPDGFQNGGISLPKDEKNRGKAIEAAIDYIADENWPVAIERLQKLLEIDEDVFVRLQRKNAEGKEVFVWVSAKQEADRLIGTLPPAGLDFYKATYGARAADMLKKAKKNGDPALLAQVVKRFAHTEAGGEAVKLLADYHLDRGNYPGALFCYSRLLNREGADKLPPEVLAKAWIAAKMSPSSGSNTSLAGNMLGAEELSKRLREQARGELKFGDQAVALEDFEGYVATLQRPGFDQNATDATVFRATPNRGNQLVGGPAFMSAARRWRMFQDEDAINKAAAPLESMSQDEEKSTTHTQIREALTYLGGKNQPALPAFAPITITVNKDGKKKPLLIYKNYWGLVARDLKNGEIAFAAPSNWSLQRLLARDGSSTEKVVHLKQWLGQYQNQYPQIVFENSTVGTLSTDGQFVYTVEDLAVPPPPQMNMNNGMNIRGGMPNSGASGYPTDMQKAIDHNKLQAYNVVSGKLVWELPSEDSDDKGPLSDCYFLGPPLPLGGKLYLLVDKQQELRLICLENVAEEPGKPAHPRIVSSQALGTTQEKMQNDVFRRITAAHLAYGEGILVCSTNAGAVFGINLLENSLVWAYPYREKSDQPKPDPQQGRALRARRGMIVGPNGMPPAAPLSNHEKHWKACCPIIADGKVVFTAPDARSLHCINLRDGSPVWRKPKLDTDLYLGNVHNGTVLVVGKKNVRGLSLATGEGLWTTELEETGLLPSGLGIGSDNIYYLPLASIKNTDKKPQIWAIDMDHEGKVIGRNSSRPRTPGEKDYDVPGNLLFYEGDVISLTTEEITVYPQLKRKIAEIDELIAKNPQDPINLTERGDLRLAQGELGDAIEDLNAALKNMPDAQTRERARSKLYDALTSYIADHFNEAEKYLKEYEELCNLDVDNAPAAKKAELRTEQRRRRATFLWLVGKGREEQGQLVEAFEKYQQFGAEAGKQSELIEAVDERQVKAAPDVWSRGRILAMMSKATPEERAPLEKLIADKWAKLRETNDLGELRAFVRMFGSASDAGKEARLQLVERLMEQRDGNDEHPLLEAELELNQFRTGRHTPELAARATEALARLYTRKGMLEDAAHCYRQLAGEFAKVQVRDGKTGRQIYDDDAATDKRLIPYLDDPQPLGSVKFGTGKKESVPFEQKQAGGKQQFFQFEHSGENLPFFRHHIVGVAFTGSSNESFKLFDRKQEEEKGAPKEVWATKLTFSGFIPSLNSQGAWNQPNANISARIPYQTMGHLIVLPAGRMLYGIDPVGRRVLWERDLAVGGSGPVPVDPRNPRGIAIQATIPDPRDGSLWVVYLDNWAQRVGQAGALRGQIICVQTRDALTALDPLTGRSLWSRSDVNTDVNLRNHIFADEEYVFIVEEDNNGIPHPTRVFRAADGITVKAPDFAAVFQKRLQIFGRYILLSENGPGNRTVVRLYDPLTGADVWKQSYAARSLVTRSEDPSLAGVVEPDGKFHVLDLRTRKEVMAGQLDKEDEAEHLPLLRNVKSVHLLFDRQNFYFACQGQAQRGQQRAPGAPAGAPGAPGIQVAGNNGMLSGVMTQQGMRTVPVNGYLYAFERDSGEMAWNAKVENQFLILDQFRDSPLVLFATRQQQVENQGGRMRVQYPVSVLGIEKRSGRTVFEDKNVFTSNGNSFFAIRLDARASTVELLSYQTRVVFRPEKGGKEAKESKPAADVPAPPRSGTRINRPAVDRVRIREVADPLPSR